MLSFSFCAGYSCPGHIFLKEVYSLIDKAKQHDASGYAFDHTFIPSSSQQSVNKSPYLLLRPGHRTHGESESETEPDQLNFTIWETPERHQKEIKSSLEARYRRCINEDVSIANDRQKNRAIRTTKR